MKRIENIQKVVIWCQIKNREETDISNEDAWHLQIVTLQEDYTV